MLEWIDQRFTEVSIHALTRSATLGSTHFFYFKVFQSTHSRGVRLASVIASSFIFSCFNPRTHEECDGQYLCKWRYSNNVSIHALTRSATDYGRFHQPVFLVSIHALTRSATSKALCVMLSLLFQSTHSRGVRQGMQ